MAKPRMSDRAARVLRRTGADALDTVTVTGSKAPAAPAWKHGAGRNQSGYMVTTFRVTPDQWRWLRKKALGRALESGAKADASEIVRELLVEAMKHDK
jgi:hypothetical protein